MVIQVREDSPTSAKDSSTGVKKAPLASVKPEPDIGEDRLPTGQPLPSPPCPAAKLALLDMGTHNAVANPLEQLRLVEASE